MRLWRPTLGGICALVLATTGCVGGGEDYIPIYFPQADVTGVPAAKPNPEIATPASRACHLQFHAELCVALKGARISVGNIAEGEEPLCTSTFGPIVLKLSGSTVTLEGETFPDIIVEGHGLPVPITINGRGDGDGKNNIGSGTLSGNGALQIDNFDFYISALDSVGAIDNFALTTGETAALPDMTPAVGSPISDTGELTLVGATTLGALFPSADEYLLDAGMTAILRGTLSPTPDTCDDAGLPTTFETVKLVQNSLGEEVPVPVPNSSVLEISSGTFIAQGATDVGPRFSATAKFRLTNISPQAVAVRIPPMLGAFLIESTGGLNQSIAPKGSIVLRITFQPTGARIKTAGTITETLTLGEDAFVLSAVAQAPEGLVVVDHITMQGAVVQAQIADLRFPTVAVPASPRRAWFSCQQILCGGSPFPTACAPCPDGAGAQCQLLAVNAQHAPTNEMDAACAPRHTDSEDVQALQLTSDGLLQSQVLVIRNMGVKPLTITDIRLRETVDSQSRGQFLFEPGSVFVADDITRRTATPAGADTPVTPFPLVLPPYDPPHETARLFLVVGYLPTDLQGADGRQAGVGTIVHDQAQLEIRGDAQQHVIRLKGDTTIQDVPALQVHFKTGSGSKARTDGAPFAFQGLTMETTDLAVPLFIQIAENATHSVRVTSLTITGEDASAFEWLDLPEKIQAKDPATRCSNPVFDAQGHIISVHTDLKPVPLAPQGYTLSPGATDPNTMPFFGCVNFHREPGAASAKRRYEATLRVTTQALGPDQKPLKNPDGSIKQSELAIPLLAVLDPLQGRLVFRVTQTMSLIMNQDFPSVASSYPADEIDALIAAGQATETDRFLYIGGIILDPFDEMTITDESGNVTNAPGDGHTAMLRGIDTRPTATTYEDPKLGDYTNLGFDALAPKGQQGLFFDYPNVPEQLRATTLKVFTGSLSYPGPVAPLATRPQQPSQCEAVDPCSAEGQRKYGSGPTQPGKKGVCAYFFISAGAPDSPSFHAADAMPGGSHHDLCATQDVPELVHDVPGGYQLDGELHFDVTLRFWGPTVFHNPAGQLGPKPVLDEFWRIGLTTGVVRPPRTTRAFNPIRTPRLNLGKLEYKMNLTDTTLEIPAICGENTDNIEIQGKRYSSWRYLRTLLSRDEEGKIPAGCPPEFTGGSAFLHGRPIDHETGIFTVVGATKFSANPDLTFVFQDVSVFLVLNGWLCDPNGSPDALEGERCYDTNINERDRRSQLTTTDR